MGIACRHKRHTWDITSSMRAVFCDHADSVLSFAQVAHFSHAQTSGMICPCHRSVHLHRRGLAAPDCGEHLCACG